MQQCRMRDGASHRQCYARRAATKRYARTGAASTQQSESATAARRTGAQRAVRGMFECLPNARQSSASMSAACDVARAIEAHMPSMRALSLSSYVAAQSTWRPPSSPLLPSSTYYATHLLSAHRVDAMLMMARVLPYEMPMIHSSIKEHDKMRCRAREWRARTAILVRRCGAREAARGASEFADEASGASQAARGRRVPYACSGTVIARNARRVGVSRPRSHKERQSQRQVREATLRARSAAGLLCGMRCELPHTHVPKISTIPDTSMLPECLCARSARLPAAAARPSRRSRALRSSRTRVLL